LGKKETFNRKKIDFKGPKLFIVELAKLNTCFFVKSPGLVSNGKLKIKPYLFRDFMGFYFHCLNIFLETSTGFWLVSLCALVAATTQKIKLIKDQKKADRFQNVDQLFFEQCFPRRKKIKDSSKKA
jgi:hypothetical protein